MRKVSRDEWILGGFAALGDGGFEALRVEPLAARLGVTKGSFYHHFENRRALHLALLDAWEEAGTRQIIDEVDGASTDPADRFRALAHRTIGIDPEGDIIENAIRAWASNDDVVAEAVARVDDRRVDYVAALLRDGGMPAPLARRRSKLFYRVLIGEFMWRDAGGPRMSPREIDETVDVLLRK